MLIRPATVGDAAEIAALIREFAAVLVEDPAAAGPFWASMSAKAHARNLQSARFRYTLACAGDEELLGFIAMRDERHLFNLYVRERAQRQGIGRALWRHALKALGDRTDDGDLTVNASLDAVAFYRALEFREAAAVVRTQGIAFVPMRLACPGGMRRPGAGPWQDG
jgi:ribosomal protein S18 acetylase RimI-like enzyme